MHDSGAIHVESGALLLIRGTVRNNSVVMDSNAFDGSGGGLSVAPGASALLEGTTWFGNYALAILTCTTDKPM